MKKIKFILPVLLLFCLTAFAQDHKETKEQIKALKVSYLTTELKLTSEESAKFWPVYNAYDEKERSIKHEKMRGIMRKIDQAGGMDKLSEKEAAGYLTQFQEAEQELADLKQKLINDLKPIIGSVKTLKLQKSEFEFNKKLLKKFKGKKQ